MAIHQIDAHESFGSIVNAGISILRARLGFFLIGGLAIQLPMLLMSGAVLAMQWDYFVGLWGHFGDLAWITANQPSGPARVVQLLNYPVMFVSNAAMAAFHSRGALDVIRDTPDALPGTLGRTWKAVLWVAVMDTALVVVVYIGCVCCLLPGIVGFTLTYAWLSFQTVFLADDPSTNWFEAGRNSYAMSRGRGGTVFGITLAFLTAVFVLYLVAASLGLGVFRAINGGFTASTPGFTTNVAIAYAIGATFCWIPGTLLMGTWFATRAAYYHYLRYGNRVDPHAASVFA